MKSTDLRKKILAKQDALKDATGPKYITGGLYYINNLPVAIKTATQNQLVNICTHIIHREAALDYLDLDTTISGFTPKEWKKDCKERLAQLQRKDELNKLAIMATKSLSLLDDDERKTEEIDTLASEFEEI
jgi:hypothetical protein